MIARTTIVLSGDEAECVARKLSAEELGDGAPALLSLPEGDAFIEDDDAARFLSQFAASGGRGLWALRNGSAAPAMTCHPGDASPATGTLLEELLPRINASLTADLPTGSSVMPDLVASIDAIDRAAGTSFEGTELEALAKLFAESIDLGSLGAFRQAAKNREGRTAAYGIVPASGEGSAAQNDATRMTTRPTSKEDLLGTLSVLVAIGRLERALAPLDAARVAAVIPDAHRIIGLVPDIIEGHIGVVMDPSALPLEIGALYQADCNVLLLKGIGLLRSAPDASIYIGKPPSFDALALHELVHAVQDRERRHASVDVAEGEAFAMTQLYVALRNGKAPERAPRIELPDISRRSQHSLLLNELFGRKAADHIDRIYWDSLLNDAADAWAKEALRVLQATKAPKRTPSLAPVQEAFAEERAVQEIRAVLGNAHVVRYLLMELRKTNPRPLTTETYTWDDGNRRLHARQQSFKLPDDAAALRDSAVRSIASLQDAVEHLVQQGEFSGISTLRSNMKMIIAQMMFAGVALQRKDRAFDIVRYFDATILPAARVSCTKSYADPAALGL